MNEQTTRLILIISAFATIIGFLLMLIGIGSEIGPKLALGGSAISQMASLFYLWPSSSITQKKIWKFMIGAVVLTALGAFVYQHSNILGTAFTTVGYLGVIGFYYVHFLQKIKPNKLDVIKLAWVVTTYLLMLLNYMIDSLPTDLEFFTTPILWYGAYLYYNQQNKQKHERQKAGW